jgi:hypothetical protein
MEKESGKLRVCIDFCNLNRATPKYEYHMHVATMLINNASGNRVISFFDGNAGYNQFSWLRKMHLKWPLYVQALLVY